MSYDVIGHIQAIIDQPKGKGEPPPFAVHMGFSDSITYTRVAVGEFDLEWRIEPYLCHRDGFVQGGIVGVVTDMAQSFAFWSTSNAPETYSTTDLHIRFTRPIIAGTLMRVESRVLNRSKRTGVIESRVVNVETGKLHAVVTGGWVLMARDI